jgi:hypothetical protein
MNISFRIEAASGARFDWRRQFASRSRLPRGHRTVPFRFAPGYDAGVNDGSVVCMSLCLIAQAAGYDTPRRRFSSSAETLFFDCAKRYIARNHVVSGSLVAPKIVPDVTVV